MEKALKTICQKFGRCDALINGAGGNRKGATVPPDGVFTDLDLTELEKVFALNYKARSCRPRCSAPNFAKQGRGIVVNTSSMSALAR